MCDVRDGVQIARYDKFDWGRMEFVCRNFFDTFGCAVYVKGIEASIVIMVFKFEVRVACQGVLTFSRSYFTKDFSLQSNTESEYEFI